MGCSGPAAQANDAWDWHDKSWEAVEAGGMSSNQEM